MNCKSSPPSPWLIRPSTFSKPNAFGLLHSKILSISKTNVPRVSANPFLSSAQLNGWHGNPANNVSKSGIESASIFVISPATFLFGWLCLRTDMACYFISEMNTHSVCSPFSWAANSRPFLIPPIPANKSIILRFIFQFYFTSRLTRPYTTEILPEWAYTASPPHQHHSLITVNQ